MPPAKIIEIADCPDCGASLTNGVCTACALDFLTAPTAVRTVLAKYAELDVEFGRYLLRRKLASGGMGVVYIAEDQQLKRKVALKMIRGSTFADESERARFTVESEAVAGLDHPNIVPIYEIGMIEEQPFFTMKLIDGRSLGEVLRDGGIDTRQLAVWLCQIARAVEHAHRRGVLHRDLKPGNILIDLEENAWLMDFGLAKLQNEESGLTRSSDHLGTPNYMPPEILGGRASDVSTASDVWSLGVILWEMICGKTPFDGSGAAEIMRKIAEEEPSRALDVIVNRDLLTLAQRCLEKDPARRVRTAGQVADELDRWLRGEALHVRRITPAERLWKWVRRKPALAALYVAMAVGSISSLILWQHAEKAVQSLTQTNEQLNQALAISTSTKLAMEARVQVDEDPGLALLLAVEAIEQTEQNLGGVLPESVDALHAVLTEVGGKDVSPDGVPEEAPAEGFIVQGFTPNYVPQFSSDGRWMLNIGHAVDQSDGVRAAIFDLQQPIGAAPSRSWKLWESLDIALGVCWLPESEKLVALGDWGKVCLWNLSQLTPEAHLVGTLEIEGYTICYAFVAPAADRKTVRGLAIYDVTGDDDANGVYRTFQVDIASQRLMLGEVRTSPEIRDAGTSYHVPANLSWLLSESEDQVTLSKLAADGNPSETAIIDIGASGRPAHPKFDRDGNWLAFERESKAPLVFDLRSGSAVIAVESALPVPGVKQGSQILAISPTEPLLVVEQFGEIRVVDVARSETREVLELSSGKQLGASFSSDGKWIGIGGTDGVVRAWPVGHFNESAKRLEFRGISTAVLDVTFAPGGRSIIAEGLGSTFRHWDIGHGKGGAQPEYFGSESSELYDVATSSDGRWIASGSLMPGEVKLVDTRDGKELRFLDHAEIVSGVAFSPDDRWFASTGRDGFVKVWEFSTLAKAVRKGSGRPAPNYEFDTTHDRLRYHRHVAFHPRGVLYATTGDGFLYEWDLNVDEPAKTRKEYQVHTLKYQLPGVKVSPDGKWLAVARHGWDGEPIEGSTQYWNMVLLYDVSEPGPPIPVAELIANFNDTTDIDFSSDGRWLAAGSAGEGAAVGDLTADDVAASRCVSDFDSQRMSGIAFRPDSELLAVAGSDGLIHLWNWRDDSATRTISSGQWLGALDWLTDSKLVAVGTDGMVEVWETDLAKLKDLARTTAGRELTGKDRSRFRIR